MPCWRPQGSRDNITIRPIYWWNFRLRRELKEASLGPNGRDEHSFAPLDRVEPGLDEELRSRWAARWVQESGFPQSRQAEAEDVLDLRVAPDEDQLRQLRATSRFTGSTTWLHRWNGDVEAARGFVDEFAESEAQWVQDERRTQGPTEWDEPA